MKRMISLLLTIVMALSATACQQSKEPVVQNTPAEVTHDQISWNVNDIYENQEAFEKELSLAQDISTELTTLKGKLDTVDGVVSCYQSRDELHRLNLRLETYTALLISKNQSDSQAKELSGKVNNWYAQSSAETAFALPEIFANPDSFLDEVAVDERMNPYLTRFNREREQSAHTISEEKEQLLKPIHQLQEGAYSLFNTLVNSDLIFSNVTFPDGVERPADETNYSASYDKDNPQEFRLEYYNAMINSYRQFRNTFAQNMHNYYTAITALAASHNYESALEAELKLLDAPISVYDQVLEAADQAKPIMERYLALVKKNLDVSTLYSFECNTPIAQNPGIVYPYSESQKLIKEALEPLGFDYTTKVNELFSADRIDVYPMENKSSGAFAFPIPNEYPYILLNYTDNFESVSTLSHELGHAVHGIYAQSQESSYNQYTTSLTSEVASTLNELILSDYLIENAKTEEERQYYVAEQMSMLYASFFTQTFFARFQDSVAKEVEAGGILTADKLDQLWLQATKDSYGPLYATSESYPGSWARIPHFYDGFYVYQYAVGIAAACNIADRIQSGEPGAVEGYLEFLKGGDSGNVVELLNLAGVDISNSKYIDGFTARFDRLLTQFEDSK